MTNGRALDNGPNQADHSYTFEVTQPNDKLVLQAECSLAFDGDEVLVTITGLEQNEVTVTCRRAVPLNRAGYTLVIYPWFLYERLIAALELLPEDEGYAVHNALMAFGKLPPRRMPKPLRLEHAELNASQRRAIQLCSDSNLAFVWGPPGTGKTTTLGHIITELLAQGQRLLVTSTTNAAVDQALAKLAQLPEAQAWFARGEIVRLGQTEAETFGASLRQVVNRLNRLALQRLGRIKRRLPQLERQLEQCRHLLARLAAEAQPLQLGLFEETKSATLSLADLLAVFSPSYAGTVAGLPREEQQTILTQRKTRLDLALTLSREQLTQLLQQRRGQETQIVRQARVLLSTMTHVYLSSLLQGERFDTVIVEEAGMAILPTLFYCAALAKSKIIIVGDPKQLPPIVQSSDPYVRKAMGRNIFDVSAPAHRAAETVIMLDTQYRMHPTIGNLVSSLFYDSSLQHGVQPAERQSVAGRQPYPNAPLVLVDTASRTTCATREGSYSRYNQASAQACLDLALQAVQDGIKSVAIITPYVEQSRLIRRHLANHPQKALSIECHTVHRFQGNERDLVIFDTVDAAPFAPGILLSDSSPQSQAKNLLNVSISRARGKLIIVSDVDYFRQNAPQGVINTMLQQIIKTGLRVPMSAG